MHQVRYLIDERLPVDLSESLVFSGDSLGRLRVRAEQAVESTGRPALPGCMTVVVHPVGPRVTVPLCFRSSGVTVVCAPMLTVLPFPHGLP